MRRCRRRQLRPGAGCTHYRAQSFPQTHGPRRRWHTSNPCMGWRCLSCGLKWSQLQVATMLRISKLTDYGTVILGALATSPEQRLTAAEVAERTHIALPTVSKLLKSLQRGGLVVS